MMHNNAYASVGKQAAAPRLDSNSSGDSQRALMATGRLSSTCGCCACLSDSDHPAWLYLSPEAKPRVVPFGPNEPPRNRVCMAQG